MIVDFKKLCEKADKAEMDVAHLQSQITELRSRMQPPIVVDTGLRCFGKRLLIEGTEEDALRFCEHIKSQEFGLTPGRKI